MHDIPEGTVLRVVEESLSFNPRLGEVVDLIMDAVVVKEDPNISVAILRQKISERRVRQNLCRYASKCCRKKG